MMQRGKQHAVSARWVERHVGSSAVDAARLQQRRSARRIERQELARRSLDLDRRTAGMPRDPSHRVPRHAVSAGDAPPAADRASHHGLGDVDLHERAFLEREERGREYDRATRRRATQQQRSTEFQRRVALEQLAADKRARIAALQFELVKREQWTRDWTRCTLRIGQVGSTQNVHTRPEVSLEFQLRVKHGTTVNALIAAASSPKLVDPAERGYLERNYGVMMDGPGAPCCAAPFLFGDGAARYALREIRGDGSVRPLAAVDGGGSCGREWTLMEHGVSDGALLLLEPA